MKISPEIIEGRTFYVELDKEGYDEIDKDVNLLIQEQKVPDIGPCKVFVGPNGYKVIAVLNKDKAGGDSFYIAFRTKIL